MLLDAIKPVSTINETPLKEFNINNVKIDISEFNFKTANIKKYNPFKYNILFKPEDFYYVFFNNLKYDLISNISEEDKMQFWLLFLPEEEKNSTFYILDPHKPYPFIKDVLIKNNGDESVWEETRFWGRFICKHSLFDSLIVTDKKYNYLTVSGILVFSSVTGNIYSLFDIRKNIQLYKMQINIVSVCLENKNNKQKETLRQFYVDIRPEFKEYKYIVDAASYNLESIDIGTKIKLINQDQNIKSDSNNIGLIILISISVISILSMIFVLIKLVLIKNVKK